MKQSKITFTMLLTISVIFLFAATNILAAQPGFDDKEIRIAQFGPQTGPAAPWGAVARGSGLLFQIVNEEGGINGRKIKYFMRDDQYNPAQTAAIVKELVEREGIFAFTGGVSSAGGNAVKGFLAENKILWVTPGSAGVNTDAKGDIDPVMNPYRYYSYPLFQDEASILTKYLVEKMGFKKIGILYQNDSYGKSGLAGCVQRLDSYKMKLTEAIPVEPTDKDLASQILRFKNSGVEAVMMWVSPTLGVIAMKTSANVGFKTQWVSSNGLSDYPLMNKITGGLWEGVITGAFVPPPDSTDPLVVKYQKAAQRLAPQERWGVFFMAGIQFAESLVEALRLAGPNLSTEKVIEKLNTFKDWKGMGGKITWNKNRHQGTDSIQIQKCGPGAKAILLQDWTANELATWKK
ncbi:MAG: ABC transporter substrate-binding protein [Syntrophales bacterium]|jgi:ABC-type branched-subunit amino acid transport system substrate-binding protein|nr:ABC transporter substrate-binding protein [Syntrophales bacterium]